MQLITATCMDVAQQYAPGNVQTLCIQADQQPLAVQRKCVHSAGKYMELHQVYPGG